MNKIYILSFIFIVLQSCGNKTETVLGNPKTHQENSVSKSNHSNNINLSLLLDLSDRIDPLKYPNPTMEFYIRDIGYIKSAAEAFDSHLRNKKVVQTNDKIQLFFDPEPQNNEINTLSSQLKYSINKSNTSKELMDEIKTSYTTNPSKIYDLTIKDKNYPGSETWSFFKNRVQDYCIDDSYRNILILLTDGYLYHKNSKRKEGNQTTYITPELIRENGLNTANWKEKMTDKKFGFIPANENLSQLEILVIGINPDKKNPYEEDVIKAYWKDWFTKMNVKRFEIKNADLPSNMDKIIKNFIENKK